MSVFASQANSAVCGRPGRPAGAGQLAREGLQFTLKGIGGES